VGMVQDGFGELSDTHGLAVHGEGTELRWTHDS
jgi:hypothetical protein